MNRPPRRPRALFIAAFAFAGSLALPLVRPRLAPMTPARLERRNRSIRNLVRHCANAITAAHRALGEFERRGGKLFQPYVAPLDPRLAAVVECAEVVAAIGPVMLADDGVHAWIEVREEPGRVHLFWRGTLIEGERRGTLEQFDAITGELRVLRADGQRLPSMRHYSDEAFAAAVAAAKASLQARGHRPSTFLEIRWTKVPSFEGGLATIGLLRPPRAL